MTAWNCCSPTAPTAACSARRRAATPHCWPAAAAASPTNRWKCSRPPYSAGSKYTTACWPGPTAAACACRLRATSPSAAATKRRPACSKKRSS
ncbi:hypothetical protein G6F46_014856 [Rhizopus delemar]|nr:hypothetical protein G6F46_014856 [Rhizopus delemar]